MKSKMGKRIAFLLALLLVLTSGTAVHGYLTEEGTPAEMIRLERIVSSTSSMVGKAETITYNITGDTIVYDPPKEIALVVDVSGSMQWDINGRTTRRTSEQRITMLKNAAVSFVEKWVGRDCKISIVPFSDYVIGAPELVNMEESRSLIKLKTTINNLAAVGGTNVGDGMRVAYNTLNSSGDTQASKYVITLTDGAPTAYSINSSRDTSFYTGTDILTSTNRRIYDENSEKPLEYCSLMGSRIMNSGMKSFVIGFATESNLIGKLNTMGRDSGAARLSNGNYHYYAGSASELNQVYSDISKAIAEDIPFTSALFSELLPEGTIVEPEAVSKLEAEGYVITANYPDPADPENKIRTLITRSLSGNLSLARKYPDASTAPKDRVYQLKPYSFQIRIEYTTPGIKTFKDTDASVFYSDPFNPKDDIKYCNTSESVSVIQPVSGMSNTHIIVMPGQNESAGIVTAKVLPDTAPNIAYEKSIARWSITGSKDVKNNPVGDGSVISIGDPSVPDPLNAAKAAAGLMAGKAYVEAVSAGTNSSGAPVSGKSVVYVVEGKVDAIAETAEIDAIPMTIGITRDLNNYARKWIPFPDEHAIKNKVSGDYMTFSNWRLKDPADAEFITIEASGTAKGVKALEHDVAVLVDVKYHVPDSDPSNIILLTGTIEGVLSVGQPVTGVVVTGAAIMAGNTATISAAVTPDNALDKKISIWKLRDEGGVDVTGLGTTVIILRNTDPVNNTVLEVKGESSGKVTVTAESSGKNSAGNTEIGNDEIYVVDAVCADTLSVILWGSGEIDHEALVPSGASGHIKFTFTSDDPGKVSVNSNGKVNGLGLTTTPVTVRIRAEYCNPDGSPTGQTKELTCNVSVSKPAVDIN